MKSDELALLLGRYREVLRETWERERTLVEIEQEILGGGAGGATPKRRGRPPGGGNSAGVPDGVKATVKALQDAGGPLSPSEVAARLGIARSAAYYRLTQGMRLGFVEKADAGRYRCAATVPEL